MPANDRRVAFVGLAAYKEAGGGTETDLFAEDGAAWLTDPALLDKLAMEKLAAEAERLRAAEGWKWAKAQMSFPHDLSGRLTRARPEAEPLSAEEHDELADALNAGDEDEVTQARYNTVAEKLEGLEARERQFLSEDLARAGIIVALAGVGGPRVERGFVRAEDVPVSEPANDDAEQADRGEDETPDEEAQEPSTKPAPLPSALHAEVLAQRSGAPGVAGPAARPGASRANACAGLQGVPRQEPRQPDRCYDARARPAAGPPRHFTTPGRASVSRMIAPPGRSSFRRSATAADAEHAEWGGGPPGLHAALASPAGLDMRAWWQADQESYLGRVPKAAILAAVREGAGDDAARRIAGAKKNARAEAVATLLDGKGWLPAILRSPTS